MPTENIEELIAQIHKYDPKAETDLVRRSAEFARGVHRGKYRRSGEPVITHPFEVARILVKLHLDVESVAAALLHDVVEDSAVRIQQIRDTFNDEVADLVEGVTKLDKIEFGGSPDRQAEDFRKLFMALAADLRVILIKLADRLHNMRTLQYMPKEKQRIKSSETLDIFAPIAHRLGIYQLKWELEDLAFKYLEPEEYKKLADRIAQKREERQSYADKVVAALRSHFDNYEIPAEITGRPKHLYSIYQKMVKQGRPFNDIYDLIGVRIVVDEIKDCYAALGLLHSLWKPIPGRFFDYVAMPKSNHYRSLHTTVIDPEGNPVEVQIRTREMHKIAEFGVAAHWMYKDSGVKARDALEKYSWLRELMDLKESSLDPEEFLENVKVQLFQDEVFVFTPKGDVKTLARGATPLDFAYAVHTDVGHSCVGAKVNGRMVPLETKLMNGDIVEIITRPGARPSRDWLSIIKTSSARSKIRHWFRQKDREENIELGRGLLEREISKQGFKGDIALAVIFSEDALKGFNAAGEESLLAAVGQGDLSAQALVNYARSVLKQKAKASMETDIPAMKERLKDRAGKPQAVDGVVIQDGGDYMVTFAKCCMPVAGDSIIGYISRRRGITIHRDDCPNVKALMRRDKNKIVEAKWRSDRTRYYSVKIEIRALDRLGLMRDIAAAVSESQINLSGVDIHNLDSGLGIIQVQLEAPDTETLQQVINRIKRIEDVFDVYRLTEQKDTKRKLLFF